MSLAFNNIFMNRRFRSGTNYIAKLIEEPLEPFKVLLRPTGLQVIAACVLLTLTLMDIVPEVYLRYSSSGHFFNAIREALLDRRFRFCLTFCVCTELFFCFYVIVVFATYRRLAQKERERRILAVLGLFPVFVLALVGARISMSKLEVESAKVVKSQRMWESGKERQIMLLKQAIKRRDFDGAVVPLQHILDGFECRLETIELQSEMPKDLAAPTQP